MSGHSVTTTIQLNSNGAVGQLNQLASASQKADVGTKGLQGSLGKLGGALAVGAVVKKAADEFINYNKNLSSISTLVPDFVNQQKNIKQGINEVSKATGVARSELAEGYYEALSSDIKVTKDMGEANKFLADSTKLAKAGFTDSKTAVDGLTTVLNSYKMEADQTTRVSDILVKTQDLGKASVGEMASTLGTVIPIAASMNVEFEQMGAIYSVLTARGTNANVVATDTKNILNSLNNSSSALGKEFQHLAKKDFKTFIEEGGTVQEAIQKVHDETKKPLGKLVDRGSINTFMTLAQSGEDFSKALGVMRTSAGATEEGFKRATDNIQDNFSKLTQSILAEAEPMAMTVMDFTNDLLKAGNAIPAPFKRAAISAGAMNVAFKGLNKLTQGLNLKDFGKSANMSAVQGAINSTNAAYQRGSVIQKSYMQGASPGPILSQQSSIQQSVNKTSASMLLASNKQKQALTKSLTFDKKLSPINYQRELTQKTKKNFSEQTAMYSKQMQNQKKLVESNKRLVVGSVTPMPKANLTPIVKTTEGISKMQKATSIAQSGVRGLGSAMNFLAGPYGMLLMMGGGLVAGLIAQSKELSTTQKSFMATGDSIKSLNSGFADNAITQSSNRIAASMVNTRKNVEVELTKLSMSFNKDMKFDSLTDSIKNNTVVAIKEIGVLKKEVSNALTSGKELKLSKDNQKSFSLLGANYENQSKKDIKELEKTKSKIDDISSKLATTKGKEKRQSIVDDLVKEYDKVNKIQEKYVKTANNMELKGIQERAKHGKLSADTIKRGTELVASEYQKRKNTLNTELGKMSSALEQSGASKVERKKAMADYVKSESGIVKSTIADLQKVYSIPKDKMKNIGFFDGKFSEYVWGKDEKTGQKVKVELQSQKKEMKNFVDALNGMADGVDDPKAFGKAVSDFLGSGAKELETQPQKVKDTTKKVKTELDNFNKVFDETKKSKVKGLEVDEGQIKLNGQNATKLFEQGAINGVNASAMGTGLKQLLQDKMFTMDNEKISYNGKNVTDLFFKSIQSGISVNDFGSTLKTAVSNGFDVNGSEIQYKGQNVTDFYLSGIKNKLSANQLKSEIPMLIEDNFNFNGGNLEYKGQNVTTRYTNGLKSGINPDKLRSQIQQTVDAGFEINGSKIAFKGKDVTKEFNQSLENNLNPNEIKDKIEKNIPDNVDKDVKANTKVDVETNGSKKSETEQKVKDDLPDNVEKDVKANVKPNISIGDTGDVKGDISNKLPKTVDKDVLVNVKPNVKTGGVGNVREQIANKIPNVVAKSVKVNVKPTMNVGKVGNVRNQIANSIPNSISKSVRVNINASSNAAAIGGRIGTQLVNGVRSRQGAATAAGRSLGAGAVNGARGGAAGGSAIGSFFGSGFVGGVTAHIGAAYAAGLAIGNAAKRGAKDAGDVRSPSREMNKLGRFYVSGFRIAFDQSNKTLYKTGVKLGKSVVRGSKKGLSEAKKITTISANYQKMLGQAMAERLRKAKTADEKKKIIAYYAEIINTEKRESANAAKIASIEAKKNSKNKALEKKKSELEDLMRNGRKKKKGKKTVNVKVSKKEKAEIKKKIAKINKEIAKHESDAAIKVGNIESQKKLYDDKKRLNEQLAEDEKAAQEKLAEDKAKAVEKALEKRGLISPTLSTGEAKIINITQPIQIYNQFQEVRNMDQLIRHIDTSMGRMLDQKLQNIR